MMIFRVMHAVPYSNQEAVKDVIANLHSYFTCNLLIGLAVLLSYKQFGGQPIECMLPLTGVNFNKAWEQYAENYCWSEDTYYVGFNQTVETFNVMQRREKKISYYQWIPFFLLFQAAGFKLPTLIWRYFAGQSGMRVGDILRLATNEANSEPPTRDSNINALCVHLQGALKFHYRLKMKKLTPHKVFRFLNIKYSAYYVAFIYVLSKLAFLINVLIQTELLNRYLIPNASQNFGFYAWRDIWFGNRTWQDSGLFPRVTLCDFEVREMGQTTLHTVQCVLLLNIFTEKIFVILWAWYNVLSFITLMNVTTWFYILFNPRAQAHFILNHLEMSGDKIFATETSKGLTEVQVQVERFINKYLKTDGVFILKLIAQHADIVFTTDLIAQLWKKHYDIEKQRESLKSSNERWQEHLRRFEVIEGRLTEDESKIPRLFSITDSTHPMSITNSPSSRRVSINVKGPPELKRYHSEENISVSGVPPYDSSDDDFHTPTSRKQALLRHWITRKNYEYYLLRHHLEDYTGRDVLWDKLGALKVLLGQWNNCVSQQKHDSNMMINLMLEARCKKTRKSRKREHTASKLSTVG